MNEALTFEQRVQARKDRLRQERTTRNKQRLHALGQINYGKALTDAGHKVTKGISIPVFLALLGAVTLPFGILFWLLGAAVFFGTWFGKAKSERH